MCVCVSVCLLACLFVYMLQTRESVYDTHRSLMPHKSAWENRAENIGWRCNIVCLSGVWRTWANATLPRYFQLRQSGPRVSACQSVVQKTPENGGGPVFKLVLFGCFSQDLATSFIICNDGFWNVPEIELTIVHAPSALSLSLFASHTAR